MNINYRLVFSLLLIGVIFVFATGAVAAGDAAVGNSIQPAPVMQATATPAATETAAADTTPTTEATAEVTAEATAEVTAAAETTPATTLPTTGATAGENAMLPLLFVGALALTLGLLVRRAMR
jgi:hypothetical protein